MTIQHAITYLEKLNRLLGLARLGQRVHDQVVCLGGSAPGRGALGLGEEAQRLRWVLEPPAGHCGMNEPKRMKGQDILRHNLVH